MTGVQTCALPILRIYYEFQNSIDDIGLSMIVYDGSGAEIYNSGGSTTFMSATFEDADGYIQSQLNGAGIGTFQYSHTFGQNYTEATYDSGEWTIALYLSILPSSTSLIQKTVTIIEYIPESLAGRLQPIG